VTEVVERFRFVQEAVRESSGGPLLPVAGATKPALSAPVDSQVSVLDLSGLAGVTQYDPAEMTFTALAGTPVAEVADVLARHDQYLPFDPPFASAGATLGGVVAAGTSGPNAFRHGAVRDFVIGLRFVDGTGRLVSGGGKVVKNAAGFDLPKLMVGSMGRLGAIVELTFKVFPRPRATSTIIFEAGSLEAALATRGTLIRMPIKVDALDFESGGRVLVRVGGEPASLNERITRLVSEVRVAREQLDGDVDATLWRDAADLLWVPPGSTIVRVALTARSVAAVDALVGRAEGTVRYSLGANLAWIAWPIKTSIDELDVGLKQLGLGGVALTGPPGRPLMGATRGGVFAMRVRSALDPDNRFAEPRR
jgi:glycolate dehydrogenase FAD-binding subunit